MLIENQIDFLLQNKSLAEDILLESFEEISFDEQLKYTELHSSYKENFS